MFNEYFELKMLTICLNIYALCSCHPSDVVHSSECYARIAWSRMVGDFPHRISSSSVAVSSPSHNAAMHVIMRDHPLNKCCCCVVWKDTDCTFAHTILPFWMPIVMLHNSCGKFVVSRHSRWKLLNNFNCTETGELSVWMTTNIYTNLSPWVGLNVYFVVFIYLIKVFPYIGVA